jgi:multidrug efflux pump subunit AcrA (membrane-fusion protein)
MRRSSSIALKHLLLVFVMLLVALALSACGADDTPTPLPTVGFEDDSSPVRSGSRSGRGTVAASGVVVPVEEVELAFPMGGIVETLEIGTGDRVTAGQPLAALASLEVEAAVDQAQRNLAELTSPAAIAAAEKAVAAAQQAVDYAQRQADRLTAPSSMTTEIRNLEARIDLAEDELLEAASGYRQVESLPDGDPDKAAALVEMTDAQLRLDDLADSYLRTLSRLSGADVDAARADLEAAKAALDEARWYLAALKGEPVPGGATGSSLDLLERTKDELAVAAGRLESAMLISPIAGTVTLVSLSEGEYASPGQAVITVSDIDNLRVETTDLSERDVTEVEIGQEAVVYLEALDLEVEGQVAAIAPVAETLGGDVVYRATIDLESQPDGLRPGMSAEVRIDTTS